MSAWSTKSWKKRLRRSDLKAPNTAADLVRVVVQTGDPYCAAAVYGIASSEQRKVLEAIMFGKRRDALKLARWEHTPAAVLQALSNGSDAGVEVRLDKNPGTPSRALSQLYAGEHSVGGRNAVLTVLIAQHQHTPIDVLEKIAQFDDDMESLKAVSRNSAANGHVLKMLIDRMPGVFDRNVVANPSTPADLLEQIYVGSDAFIRAAAIAHANCPQSLVDLALSDDDVLVLRQLARDKRLDKDMLARLANNADAAVRCGVASNPASPKALIRQLLNDEACSVRRAVAARADLTAASIKRLMHDTDRWVRQWLGRNPIASRKVMETLATDSEMDVRRAVARNPRCPTRLLDALAKDENAWVRSAVAYQSNAPRRLMVVLAEDIDIDVLSGVASNLHTPQTILQRLAASPEADVRRGVILNRNANRATLLPLLEDPYYLHRLLLAVSTKLKEVDKWQLCEDPDSMVRFAAFRWFAGKLGKEVTQ